MKRASPNDVPQLVTMMGEFYAEGGYPLNQQRATEAFATLLADDRLGCVWFIQTDGQDVGYVVLTLCYSMEYGGLNAFVDDLYVRKPFRRAGLGTAPLRVSHSALRTPHSGPAVYRRVGFTQTDRQLLALKLANPTHED